MNEPWEWGENSQPQSEYDTAPGGTRFLMCGYDAHPKAFASGDWVRYKDYKVIEDALRGYIEREELRRVGEAMAQQAIDSGSLNREKNEVIARLQKDKANADAYIRSLEEQIEQLKKGLQP